jgi:hypothetical protein
MRLEILLFLVCIVFTLVSVVFVMSPIIHTYRHLSIAVCNNSRSFCKVFVYRRKLLLHKDLRQRGGGFIFAEKASGPLLKR